MANEAASTIVLKMRDEASAKMENFGRTTDTVAASSLDMQVALVAVGGALNAVGSLLGQIDSPAAKVAQTFFTMGGAIFSSVSAIMIMLPHIKNLISTLRNLAIIQTIVKALMGPVGWAQLGIGLAIAGAATAGIIAATGGFGGGGTTSIKMEGGPILMNDDAAMREFSLRLNQSTRREEAAGR